MGLQHLLTLLPLVASIVQAQLNDTTTNATATDESETVSSTIYSPEECDSWISTVKTSDADASNGLSSSEYYEFLSGIEEPPYIAEYFQEYASFDVLPWVFRVVHKSLACHCQQLGLGEECCEGDSAEVLLLGLEESANPTNAQEEYRDLFCQQIAYILTKSIPSPAPTAGPSVSPSKLPTTGPTQSPSLAPVTLSPVTSTPTTSSPVVGRSDPPSVSLGPTMAKEVELVRAVDTPAEEDDSLGTGGIIGIILALLVAFFAVIALVAYRRKLEQDRLRKLAEAQVPEADLEAPPPAMEEKEPLPEPEPAAEPEQAPEPDEDDESSAPSVWSESDDDEDMMGELHDDNDDQENAVSAGSALAAMGAASTVAAHLMSPTSSTPNKLEPEGAVIGETNEVV
mmetsp:Transcript_12358/g.26836  ORF Transcript_12358/g.26836 Transcript_12358/m.26836 type:complete len:398 (-) Transcript_12358:233-1426(-)|eukprot:CAMPEP_0172298738 /NCGR_PEP_ID=MMETSP1058-20130122/1253_1 /TAXON_ID=83371 /ORGANISM="Detonula confervacea, Strain CCMP 353" /LENGTH=397 /DNA_ID=CAMNT_0013008027 /DNA_START=268 /DNA_END=1461 /DNA_ORIENTATION=-